MLIWWKFVCVCRSVALLLAVHRKDQKPVKSWEYVQPPNDVRKNKMEIVHASCISLAFSSDLLGLFFFLSRSEFVSFGEGQRLQLTLPLIGFSATARHGCCLNKFGALIMIYNTPTHTLNHIHTWPAEAAHRAAERRKGPELVEGFQIHKTQQKNGKKMGRNPLTGLQIAYRAIMLYGKFEGTGGHWTPQFLGSLLQQSLCI